MSNQNESNEPKKVFISYSWDSEEHKERVQKLADKLIGHGFKVLLDIYEHSKDTANTDWLLWMDKKIDNVSYIFVICTEGYKNCFDDNSDCKGEGGVKAEARIIRQKINDGIVFPLIFEEFDRSNIPVSLNNFTRFELINEDYLLKDETLGYTKLYRKLTNQHKDKSPKIGEIQILSDTIQTVPNKNKSYISYRDGYIEPKTVKIEELGIHVAICPVTFEEYDLCFNNTNSCYAKDYEYKFERKKYPVVNVSWKCVDKYIKWLNIKTNKNYDLLSSEEWDYISKHDRLKEEELDNYIWHKDNTINKKIQEVCRKKYGNLGLYDLYGNVHEWCSDKRIRGNSFKYSLDEIFKNIDRVHLPNHTKDVLGFRIVIRS